MGPGLRRAALAGLVALSACAAQRTDAAANIEGIAWIRTDDEDAAPHFAQLRVDGARAAGFAGCNNFTAGVEGAGQNLRFTAIASTRMACAESGMATERNMLSALERTRAYRLGEGEFFLLDQSGAQLARFNAE